VFNMLLQIMEEGHLTDSFGRKVDFKNTIVIMTTNIGASAISQGDAFGFSKRDADTSYDRMKERLMQEIEREFKPEFIGRLDEVVVFRQLTKENLKEIVDIELFKVRERLGEKGFKLVLSDEAREFIIEKGGAVEYGARPLRRAVENFIEDPLSENLLQGIFQGANTITVKVKEVAEKKQLEFEPSTTEGEPELVGATAGEEEVAS
jgi:ATP-dependent Clp protease ATP-binding subunit ClpC